MTILFWMSIALLAVMLWKLVSANGEQARVDQPSYSEFMAKVEAGEVKEVTMHLGQVSYELHGEYIRPANRKFQVTIAKEDAANVTKELRDKDVPGTKGPARARASDRSRHRRGETQSALPAIDSYKMACPGFELFRFTRALCQR